MAPGPVFPKPRKEVWRGMTQEELDAWQLKTNRLLSVVAGQIQFDLGWPAPGEWEDRLGMLEERMQEIMREATGNPEYMWEVTCNDTE